MPLQNRVTPMGEIVAVSERGLFTGNRGIIHNAGTRTLLQRRWTSRAWLICALHWRDVRRTLMGFGTWTELFFLDEATALAAGHRPCFFCRRASAQAFQLRFPHSGQLAKPKAGEIDKVLHAERLEGRRKRLHALTSPAADLPDADLPDGAMVLQDGAAYLILSGAALPWSHAGYGAPVAISRSAALITPPSTVAVLRAGYRPQLHVSAIGKRSANQAV